MDLGKIEKLLQLCDLEDLLKIQEILHELIDKSKKNESYWSDAEGKKRRREERFQTNLLGTLTRITDVKPGERKEYSVTVTDISRGGMCVKVDSNFIPSRVVEVTFASPGGKIKRCFVEIVRMRKMSNQDGEWLEVGCRSVNNEEVRRLRLREEQVAKTRSKLHNRHNILIMLVGTYTEINNLKLDNRLKNLDYSIRCVDTLHQAMKTGEKIGAQLAIICSGSAVAEDPNLLKLLENKPKSLAILAIIKEEQDRQILLQHGVDECLPENNIHEFLFYGIERAVVGHTVRYNRARQQLSGRALIVSIDNMRINMISYQLEENGYSFRIATDVNELQNLTKDPFDMILADYDAANNEEFLKISYLFGGIPIIALCEDISHGQQAIVDGAANYLCMPPSKEDMRIVMELVMQNMNSNIV